MPLTDANTLGSLAEKLMSYVSPTPQQDANYDSALAMLTHYGKLKNLSLAGIADLCYVSKASISRFCRFMGFDGFRELHDCLLQDFSIEHEFYFIWRKGSIYAQRYREIYRCFMEEE